MPAPKGKDRLTRSRAGGVLVLLIGLAAAHLNPGCQPDRDPGAQPRQAPRDPLLAPARLDDAAARFADALRRWPVVARAATPVLLAGPQWRLDAPEPIPDRQGLADRLTQAVNLRCGAKVRIVPPDTTGCRYATELVVRRGTDKQGSPVLVLAFRVVRPGTGTVLLEEVATARRLKPKPSPLFAPPPTPAQTGPSPDRAYLDIDFDRGRVRIDAVLAKRTVSLLGERTWRDAERGLQVELRLLSRPTATTVSVVAYGIDADGRHQTPPAGALHMLSAYHPTTVSVALPTEARAYEIFIVPR